MLTQSQTSNPPCGIAARFPKLDRDDFLAATELLPPTATETAAAYIDRARFAGVLRRTDCMTLENKSIGAGAIADRFFRCRDF